MPNMNERARARNAPRRDAPVSCASCGREVAGRARQQRFCSARCKEKARTRVRKAFLGRHTSAPTNPPKNINEIKALERVKTLSSHGILGPAHVFAVELNRDWQPAISSDGVAIEIGRLRTRFLV